MINPAIYAPYIPLIEPWYHGQGQKRYSWVVGVDNTYEDKAVFIITPDNVWYDYDNHDAWTTYCHIKSKNKLRKFRKLCKEFILRVAENKRDYPISELEDMTIKSINIATSVRALRNTYATKIQQGGYFIKNMGE